MESERGREPARVVLVGGGHAHVEVLRRWARKPVPGARLCVVLDRSASIYSGMVPGYVAGTYRREELTIDVAALARAAGADVLIGAARMVEPMERSIDIEGHGPLRYDFASLNIGSAPRALDVPGVREFAVAIRPIEPLMARTDQLLGRAHAPLSLLVVGGGAAGVEMAFALHARLRVTGRGASHVAIIERGPRLLGGQGAAAGRRVRAACADRDIDVRFGQAVAAVEEAGVRLADGTRRPADLVVWATGAGPPALLESSPGLPRDVRGFLRVTAALEVVGHPGLFGAGDCVVMDGHPLVPKAGVYAVRQAPILDHNLRALAGGRPLASYHPQKRYLSLLSFGDGTALASWGGLACEGRLVGRAKDWNDRRWIHRFGESFTRLARAR